MAANDYHSVININYVVTAVVFLQRRKIHKVGGVAA